MILQTEKKYYTPEEYLTLEEKATDKHEYRDGEIVVMPGGTTNHNQIAGNFYKRFPLNIQKQDYYVYMNDVRLWIPQYRLYTYPDVMVIKGKPIYEGKGITNVTNPLIIVEVLSRSTRDYDLLRSAVGVRTDKFEFYRSIPEFQEYILIDQYRFYATQYFKQGDGKWIFSDYKGEESLLKLASDEFEISLKDLYARVDFELDEG
ncbi:MAG: Uma2 family endonuclease [Microcystis sp. M53603_WE2]|jgi:Uma2 family endonuclease|uniref:Putative restriction endonuclease domain-containing protein n=1 Tax=Microcystis aeruginosa PCC 9717 TaxID=1160286 RepID=I4FLZ6_MICAE|nr:MULTISPECIES: Uma2 family endonuclease [Microcystis]MCE2664257.1 Uma2 family endonuclease [Microcystis sp. 53602_E8]MDJ0524652.1 Uma2 family endonuclease [Microcystis sp. M53600_WE12]MCZ8025829.1 Uma2 family endonuclease [Microcystis sp. LE19-10.1B]MCZ8118663.1 Uma2 family endonuclease [Microcystis sp. LE18-22.4A]MDJ0540108.1 Uma2 family endonuclease [Microcystis sp. M53603_WE2]